MGHFGRKHEDGERPGASVAKLNKEIEKGRVVRKSPQELRLKDQTRRLNDLEKRISSTSDPKRREPLYLQYTNLAACCDAEVFSPNEIAGIETYSSLVSQETLHRLDYNRMSGERRDFLPLHHLLKLIDKKIPENKQGDKYIYLLGTTSRNNDTDPSLRNLRALEYFLGTFAGRLIPGQELDLEIDKKRIQVPYSKDTYLTDESPLVKNIRHRLQGRNIPPSPEYNLRRIKDGHYKISANINIVTEERPYIKDGIATKIILSYVMVR